MTNKTERQISEMKKQTIGVEVEMNSITRQTAAKLAAEFFGTGRWEDTARRNGYSCSTIWGTSLRYVVLQKRADNGKSIRRSCNACRNMPKHKFAADASC